MDDKSDIFDGKLIYTYIPEDRGKVRITDDIPEEYRVYENPEASNGIIIYAKYRGQWHANPWNHRCLVRHLIEEITANNFWRNIVLTEDGAIDMEQVKKELHDFRFIIQQVPKVYMAVSGDMLSKPNYYADVVIRQFEDYVSKLVEEEVSSYRDDVERLTKEISDTLHPDGNGPENPSLCDVAGYIKHDFQYMRDFIQELADEPCAYGDNCPDFVKTNHGKCLYCQCKAILSQLSGGKRDEP